MTDVKPDMASLRIISDSELRLGEVIGSGAFGTVYSVRLHIEILRIPWEWESLGYSFMGMGMA